MEEIRPENAEQLAESLKQCAAGKRRIALGGAFTKVRMGGPAAEADARISTVAMNRVLQYEPQDLTVSVEAGLPWRELQRVLAENRQMVPLDPPMAESATVGGVIAANCSGPRRRLYGSPRDAVIGIRFATLEGKLVQTGGMVVKNVAGLDMGKLMIGSFGTLAAVAVVNFKISPEPPFSRTFVLGGTTAATMIAARDRLLQSVLQAVAIDLLSPQAAASVGWEGWSLLVQAAGNEKVVERWQREIVESRVLEGDQETTLWAQVREFTPNFLAGHADGAVARVSVTLGQLADVAASAPVPLVARAGTGVCYLHFADCQSASTWLGEAVGRGWPGVLEWIPRKQCTAEEQWPKPGSDFETMRRVKNMFDANGLLNRGRLYGRI